MATKRIGRLLCTVWLVACAAVARGQNAVDSGEASPRADALVVGYEYVVAAERHGVRQQLSGTLVKVNDRWIVLRCVLESRNETGVPVMSRLPYVNRLFKNVGIGRSDENIWIPRAAATSRTRTSSQPVVVQPPKGDSPPAQDHCWIESVSQGRLVRRRGDIAASTADGLTFVHDVEIAETTSVPVLGGIPVLGTAFRRTHHRVVQSRDELSHDDILCAGVPNREAAR